MARSLFLLFQYPFLLTCNLFPLTLDIQEATASQLSLAWVDNSNNEENFKIERSSDQGATFVQLATVGANITSYTDRSMTEKITYCYRVRASNSVADSAYTNIACGTVQSEPQSIAVSLTEPLPGTTVFGSSMRISALVTGNIGAVNVQFFVDGSPLGKPATSFPYRVTWDTTTAIDGLHQLTAEASTANSISVSTSVDVMVSNFGTTRPSPPQTYLLKVTKTGSGDGTVTSNPAGLSCKNTCTATYNKGAVITLIPTPMPGSIFAGWDGACVGNKSCTVTMTTARSVTAIFTLQLHSRIGIFRPDTGEWYLDVNGNGTPDDCAIEGCIQSFGQKKELPVVGDWFGAGATLLGVFDPATRLWKLDRNGNDLWENCAVDLCLGRIFSSRDLPLVGHWTPGAGTDRPGVYRSRYPDWRLDLNGNGVWDGCKIDGCGSFGKLKGLPVVGDWTGSGTTKIGIFDQATGQWKLDRNGNRKWDGCGEDSCTDFFDRLAEDYPIAGDWTGTGRAKIGVFNSTTGNWKLDINGNGKFDGCDIDACLGPFGQPGDLPVVGKW